MMHSSVRAAVRILVYIRDAIVSSCTRVCCILMYKCIMSPKIRRRFRRMSEIERHTVHNVIYSLVYYYEVVPAQQWSQKQKQKKKSKRHRNQSLLYSHPDFFFTVLYDKNDEIVR